MLSLLCSSLRKYWPSSLFSSTANCRQESVHALHSYIPRTGRCLGGEIFVSSCTSCPIPLPYYFRHLVARSGRRHRHAHFVLLVFCIRRTGGYKGCLFLCQFAHNFVASTEKKYRVYWPTWEVRLAVVGGR